MKRLFHSIQDIAFWSLVLAAVCFTSFCMIARFLGGEALTGYKADGRYYLGNHGSVTEVSATVYAYSKWHGALSIFLMISAGVVTFAAYESKKNMDAIKVKRKY